MAKYEVEGRIEITKKFASEKEAEAFISRIESLIKAVVNSEDGTVYMDMDWEHSEVDRVYATRIDCSSLPVALAS